MLKYANKSNIKIKLKSTKKPTKNPLKTKNFTKINKNILKANN